MLPAMNEVPDNLNVHKHPRKYKPIDFMVLACFLIILFGLILIANPTVFSGLFNFKVGSNAPVKNEVAQPTSDIFTIPVAMPKFGDTPTLEQLDACVTSYASTYATEYKDDEGEVTGKIKQIDSKNNVVTFVNDISYTIPASAKLIITAFNKADPREWQGYNLPYSVPELLSILKPGDYISIDIRTNHVEYIKVDCYVEK